MLASVHPPLVFAAAAVSPAMVLDAAVESVLELSFLLQPAMVSVATASVKTFDLVPLINIVTSPSPLGGIQIKRRLISSAASFCSGGVSGKNRTHYRVLGIALVHSLDG